MHHTAQKTIGIVGTRRRDTDEDFTAVEKAFLEIYKPGDMICSGLCPRGGDRFAVVLSTKYHIPSLWFPPDWGKYGRSAGFMRNTLIAQVSDVLIACVAPNRTGGTEDTIRKFTLLGKKNLVIVSPKA